MRLPTIIVPIWSTSRTSWRARLTSIRRTITEKPRPTAHEHRLLQPRRVPFARYGTRPPGVPAAAGRHHRPPARHRPGHRAGPARRRAAGDAGADRARAQRALRDRAARPDGSRCTTAASRARSTPTRSSAPAPGTPRCAPPARRWRPPTPCWPARPQNAFCAVRPPGHHATRDEAMGFCFFNNVAVAARHALDVHGLERVAIIDFDVHHGNGTEDIVAGDERVLMCSFFQHPLYPYSGAVPKGTNMVNVPVPPYTRGPEVREPIEAMWMPRLEAFAPQMLFISAGFDAHREDELGQLGLVEADYEWITRRLLDAGRAPRPGPHRVLPGRRLHAERAGAQRGRASARAGRRLSACAPL